MSHFFEIHIESAASKYNPHLYVSLRQGRYQLCTANAVYSYEDLYRNFFRAFRQIDLDRIPGTEVLVLGLGLGSIPMMLEKNFHRHYQYTAVEIDEVVIDLAHRYTLDELQSPIEIITADAAQYVQQTDRRFDLICVDIFLDDAIPECFQSDAFLLSLAEMLHAHGVVLFNRLSSLKADRRSSQRFYEEVFLRHFPRGAHLDVGGNYMLINRQEVLR